MYYKKSLYYIQEPQTTKEKEQQEVDIKKWNLKQEAADKAIQEAKIEAFKASVRYKKNREMFKADKEKLVEPWKYTKDNGAIAVKKGKGGINWYYYHKEILEPKLLPFAKKLIRKNPNTIVQEDNTGPHVSYWQ